MTGSADRKDEPNRRSSNDARPKVVQWIARLTGAGFGYLALGDIRRSAAARSVRHFFRQALLPAARDDQQQAGDEDEWTEDQPLHARLGSNTCAKPPRAAQPMPRRARGRSSRSQSLAHA